MCLLSSQDKKYLFFSLFSPLKLNVRLTAHGCHKDRKAMTRCCSIRSSIFLNEDNISCTGRRFIVDFSLKSPAVFVHSSSPLTFSMLPWQLPGAQGEWLTSPHQRPLISIQYYLTLAISITAPSFNYSRCWITLTREIARLPLRDLIYLAIWHYLILLYTL